MKGDFNSIQWLQFWLLFTHLHQALHLNSMTNTIFDSNIPFQFHLNFIGFPHTCCQKWEGFIRLSPGQGHIGRNRMFYGCFLFISLSVSVFWSLHPIWYLILPETICICPCQLPIPLIWKTVLPLGLCDEVGGLWISPQQYSIASEVRNSTETW